MAEETVVLVPLRRRAVLGAILAAAMTVLDLAVTTTALGAVQQSVGAPLDRGALVITAYVTAELVTLALSAYLTRLLPPRTYLIVMVSVFVLGSALTASAWSFESLLVARVVQGLASGAIMPFAYYAIVALLPPTEQPRAISTFSITVTATYVLGPVLSTTLGEWFTWRALYLVAAPAGALALWCALPGLAQTSRAASAAGRRVNVLSIVAAVAGLALTQYVLDAGGEQGWFASVAIIAAAIAAAVAVSAFVLTELRSRYPLVDLRLLRQPAFLASCVFNLVGGAAIYSSYFLIPFALTTVGYGVGEIGIVSVYGAGVQLVASFLLPVLLRRVDRYVVAAAGATTFAVAALIPLLAGPSPAGPAVVAALAARSVGSGLLLASLGLMMTRSLAPTDGPSGSLLFNMARSLGGSTGAAACAAFLVLRQAAHEGAGGPGSAVSAALHDTYLAAMVALALLALALLIGRLRRGRRSGAEP